jgi:small GTP-binding protein
MYAIKEEDEDLFENTFRNSIQKVEEENNNNNFLKNNNSKVIESNNDDNIIDNQLNFIEPIIYKEDNNDNENNKIIEYSFKVILLGDSLVGKTSFVNRFVSNKFEKYHCSISIQHYKKKLKIDNSTIVNLTIWDTVGQEKFRALTKQYYHDSQGAIIMFDITDKNSFLKVESWINELIEYGPKDCSIILIGNKTDLNHQRVIDFNEGDKLAEKYHILFCEVSAKIGNNINEAFEKLCNVIIDKQIKEGNNNKNENNKNNIENIDIDFHMKKKKCCN